MDAKPAPVPPRSMAQALALDPRDDLLRLAPYLSDLAEAALLHGEDTALLCAIALRETWAGWAPGYQPRGSHLGHGDGGHGFGLFQMDDRGPYRRLPIECPDASAHLQARWACQVLDDARRELRRFHAHPRYLEAALCAYNAGSPRVAWQLDRGLDPNLVTTPGPRAPLDPATGRRQGDYGRDVLFLRTDLRRRYPATFPPPAVPAGDAA